MVLSEVKKYIRIYLAFIRFSLADMANYKVNSFIGIIVDLGWNLTLIVFFWVIYGQVQEVAGWDYHEILFLNGVIIVISQANLALSYVFSLHRLPRKILRGELDHILVKPINSQFMLTVGPPYLAGFIGMITGFYLMWYGFQSGGFSFSFENFLLGSLMSICGFLVLYCLYVIIVSLAFVMDNRDAITGLANSFISFRNNPEGVYSGALRKFFLVIFPVILMGSIPARAFLYGLPMIEIVAYLTLTLVFIVFTKFYWDYMIRYYASASS